MVGGVMDGVAGWFERRGEVPLVAPPRLREYGPLSDDPDRPETDFTGDAIRGLAFALEYCDSRGWVSMRTIRCLAVDQGTPTHLKAFDNVRRTVRFFRLDRIVAIGDLRTGRVLTGEQYATLVGPYIGLAKTDPRVQISAELRDATRDGVFALLHLAMPEGRLGEASRSTILEYVRSEAELARCAAPPAASVELWIDNLSPPLDAVCDGVRTLLADKDKFARLLPWLLKIMRGFDTYAADQTSIRELLAAVRAHYRDHVDSRAASRA